MYDLFKESLEYDRRNKNYKTFLLNNCKKTEIFNTCKPNQNILPTQRDQKDYLKIRLYLSRILNNDCINIIIKFVENLKEYTTFDWYKDIYDIMRCSGINKIFYNKFITCNPKPEYDIPFIYYAQDIISYMNCFILNKIDKKNIKDINMVNIV